MSKIKKILVVNDSRFERKVFEKFLENLNYQVRTCGEDEVFDYLKEFAPEILIVNLIMKDINGAQLIKLIKNTKEYANLKFILSSNNPSKLKEAADKYVDDILVTPIKIKNLNKVLK